MTYLDLCKMVRQEARITGTGPAQVANQSGVLAEVVSATNNAWLEIQSLHDTWSFMEKVVETELAEDVDVYQLGDLGINDAAKIKQFIVDGVVLEPIEWDRLLREKQNKQAARVGRVRYYSRTPDGIQVVPVPERTVPVVIQYFKQPQQLTNNSDRPNIAPYHCRTIVWRAVMDLAANESDGVIYQKAMEKHDAHISRMFMDYLPPMRMGQF